MFQVTWWCTVKVFITWICKAFLFFFSFDKTLTDKNRKHPLHELLPPNTSFFYLFFCLFRSKSKKQACAVGSFQTLTAKCCVTVMQSLPVFTISFSVKPSFFHLPPPTSITCSHLFPAPVTMVLDIRKHTFNYPWPHISLKYLHCSAPQGDMLHDLSPNLFMCRL